MKKVIALGLVAIFSTLRADQQNWNTANTFLRFETPYQSASPERLALFNTEDIREKHRASHNGDVEFVVFGGQNSSRADAAAYYMPGGLETLTFNASIDALNDGTDTAVTYWSGAQGGVTAAALGTTAAAGVIGAALGSGTTFTPLRIAAVGTVGALSSTNAGPTSAALTAGAATVANSFVVGTSGTTSAAFNLNNLSGLVDGTVGAIGNFTIDTNKNIGVMRPWNFGVGYAPNVQFDAPTISQSQFVSTITPELKRSHWGIGATWKQLLSEKDTGFFLELSTALQRVTLNMELNEAIVTAFDADAAGNSSNTAHTDWLASWGTVGGGTGYSNGNTVAPESIEQAFAQDAWLYGKVNGAQSVTRLADIELKLGYQFICEDNVMSNMFVGLVIPTGNRAQSLFLAEPIVGNGFHFGLMVGSTSEIQLDMGSETRWSMRSDANFRYLFKNTQVRSFDTASNGQWSRYMMVWPTYAAEQDNGEVTTTTLRQYTPGINEFTKDMNVTPRSQARLNQALVLEHGSLKAEFGWNMMIRQAEQVSLVNDWVDNAIAFADASNNATSLYNGTRTIYNDSYQSTPVVNTTAGGSEAFYNAVSISASDLNLDSAASPAAFTNTPYLALGYAFNEEKSSVFSVGVSYEMSATNGYINDWTLWGKFGFSF